MEVKKLNSASVRKAESVILTGGQKVVTAEQKLKSDLTASTMGAEEEEEQENIPVRKTYGNGLGREVREHFRQDVRKRVPSAEKEQRKQKERETAVQEERAYLSRIGKGKFKGRGRYHSVPQENRSRRRANDSARNTGGVQTSSENFAEKIKAENTKPPISKESGTTTFQGKASMGKAAETAQAGEKIAGGSIKTGGSAVAGAATAGVSVAVEKTGELAVKRAKRLKESMIASMEAKGQQKKKPVEESEENRRDGKGVNAGLLASSFIILPVVIPIITVLFLLAAVFGAITQTPEDDTNEGLKIVAVALQELEDSENNIGGGKYKQWYGMNDNWCAMFVSWCADQCGYIEEGIMPRTASVAAMKKWYMDKNLYHTQESGYEPKPGDIIIFGNGKSHTGIVIAYDEDTKELTTIEGNTGTSHTDPYHKGSRVKRKSYPLNYAYIAGYGTPEYPAEEDTEDTELLEAEQKEE